MTDRTEPENVHGDDELPAELRLRQPDAEAAFTPSHGFWCTSFRARVGGMWLRILDEPPSWKALTTRPTFFGNPLLFPYPLAVRGGAFGYRGKRYTVRAGSEGYPIHGLVRDHEWTVERKWSDHGGAHARAFIDYSPAGDPSPEFPFPFRFAATYTLSGSVLFLDVEATNTGPTPMPLGFGIHPYVPIPLVPGGRVEDCVVTSDVSDLAVYEDDFASVKLQPVFGWRDIRSGVRVSDLLEAHSQFGQKGASLATLYARLDRQPSSLAGEPGGISWSLTDVARGISVRIETSDAFQTMVHYSPPTPTVISPVIGTLMPNGFNLAEAGQPSGLIELEPGASWRAWTRISVGTVER
jgi:aldose 1-epimerase